MDEKTCSIVVITKSKKTITIKCTSQYLAEARAMINKLCSFVEDDVVNNVIRIWKLGKSDQTILPQQKAIDKLADILEHNSGDGILDIVWDDMIDVDIKRPNMIPEFLFLGNNLAIRAGDIEAIIINDGAETELTVE